MCFAKKCLFIIQKGDEYKIELLNDLEMMEIEDSIVKEILQIYVKDHI